MSRKQFFALALGVFLAAVAGVMLEMRVVVSVIFALVLLGIWCVLFSLMSENKEGRQIVSFFLLGLGGMVLYFALYTGVMAGRAEKYDGFSGVQTLRAADFPDENGAIVARIITEKGASPFLVRLANYSENKDEITPGSSFTAEVSLSVPKNTKRFFSQRYFRAERIYLVGYATEISEVSQKGITPANWHKYLRHGALERFGLLYGEKAYLVKGLIFGDKSDFPAGFSAKASAVGVSHVFAVSGMHLSFLVSSVLFLSRRRFMRYIAIVVVLFFMIITGFEASVVRAGIMQIAALFVKCIGRENESFGSMALSLMVLLAFNPCSVGDIGLQFSFCAVGGILIAGEKIRLGLFALERKLPRWLGLPLGRTSSVVAVSVSSILFTLPLSVLYFDRLSIVSLVSNILMNWIVSAVFIVGTVSLILSCIWLPLGSAIAWFNSWGVVALEFLIDLFAKIPFAVLGAESVFIKLALSAAYGFGGFFFFKESKFAVLKTLAAFTLCIGTALALSYGADLCSARVTAVDSALECALISAEGRHYAVGAGDGALETLLQNRNINKLDLLIIPFVSEDEVLSASELIRSGRVSRLAISKYSGESENAEKIIACAEDAGVPVDVLSCDREYLYKNSRITVFIPASSGKSRGAGAVLFEYGSAGAFIAGRVSEDSLSRLNATRSISGIELLLLNESRGKLNCNPKSVDLEENGIVFVSGQAKNEDLPENKTYNTLELGNIDALLFGGRIYIYN